MIKYLLTGLLLLSFSLLKAQQRLASDTGYHPLPFEALLDSNRMSFTVPEGYKEVVPVFNRQMNYEKAYRHPTERFEIRYAIRTFDHNFPRQIFEATLLNISMGKLEEGFMPNYTPFNEEAVKNEFGADAGATVCVPAGAEFGQDYKYVLLIYIHKKDVGDAYIFYLADDNSIIPDLMQPVFHNLRFRD